MGTDKKIKRVSAKLHELVKKADRLQQRRERMERSRKAFDDYFAGRLSKTELRRSVPRSWFEAVMK